MKQFRSVTSHPIGARSIPLVDWPAASSGAAIGSAVALVAGSLWAAAAFSSHNGTFYNNLAWWFGGTMIGVALLGAVTAGALSGARGATAGIVNGLSSWSLIALATGAVVAITAIAHGTTSTLSLPNGALNVDLVTPYVAFWSAVAGLGAAAMGGCAGGLIPRRRITNDAVELRLGTATGLETSTGSMNGARTPSRAAR
ncbi:MAG: hypothetical protein E6G27_17505 [Actinobacteria bacterium]|nr:MAG: hypothetical protein E6G27_17505 [Actinomycetota bacterium]